MHEESYNMRLTYFHRKAVVVCLFLVSSVACLPSLCLLSDCRLRLCAWCSCLRLYLGGDGGKASGRELGQEVYAVAT